MKYARFFVLSISFLIVLYNLSFAQNKTEAPQKPFHFKKYAFQFTVPDFLKFSGFEGSLISMKYHLNDHSALRIGVNANLGSSKNNDQTNNVSDSLFANNENKDRSYSFSITLPYLYYFHPQKTIKFYSGMGPRLYYGYYYLKAHQQFDAPQQSTINTLNRKNTDFRIGLRALAGVEWFFHQSMSLNLEYGALLEYSHSKITSDSESIKQTSVRQERTQTRDSWKFYPKSIYLVLTVYL